MNKRGRGDKMPKMGEGARRQAWPEVHSQSPHNERRELLQAVLRLPPRCASTYALVCHTHKYTQMN